MFVMFRFELKLSVTISNWVTSYMLHGASLPSVGLCGRDSSRLPSAVSEPELGRVHPNQAGN